MQHYRRMILIQIAIFPVVYLLSGIYRVGGQMNGFVDQSFMVTEGRLAAAVLALPAKPVIDGIFWGKPKRLFWFCIRWVWVAWCVFTPWTWWKVAAFLPVAVSFQTSAKE